MNDQTTENHDDISGSRPTDVQRYSHVVVSKRGYRPARSVRPETGMEPAYNRPEADPWMPKYPTVLPMSLAEKRQPCWGLSGLDPDRVADSDYPWCVP